MTPLAKLTREELEERVLWLEAQLFLPHDFDSVCALRTAYGLTSAEARMVLALYAAKGRAVMKDYLDQTARVDPTADYTTMKVIDVRVCNARKKLGADSIATVWGLGYCLTPGGLALCDDALNRRNFPVNPAGVGCSA